MNCGIFLGGQLLGDYKFTESIGFLRSEQSNAFGGTEVSAYLTVEFGEVGIDLNPRSTNPALLQSTRRTVLCLKASKGPVRAGFSYLRLSAAKAKVPREVSEC